MNLWFRLIWYFITTRFRPALTLPDDISRLKFRVWPHDLDTSMHLNNGRYLALMDIGRLDLMVAGGLLRPALRHGWTPIANSIQIRFRRELRVWAAMELQTRIVGWTKDEVIIEQVFVSLGDGREGQVAARALFSGGLYDRKARSFVEISRLMEEVGVDADSPELPPECKAFLDSIHKLRDVDRAQRNT